ncbi:MAG: 2-dehydropantoate 2-reductase N-terminal domain-containing protein, partial [Phycisphaeraceae bacterium]
MFNRVTVLGDGAMATVCALLLDSKKVDVTIWGPFEAHVEQMFKTRLNEKYLPDYPLPESVRLTADCAEAISETELIVSAIPTQYMRGVWERCREFMPPSVPVVSVAKGIENDTLLRPTQIVTDVMRDDPDGLPRPVAALSGPSIARELARCLPATVC